MKSQSKRPVRRGLIRVIVGACLSCAGSHVRAAEPPPDPVQGEAVNPEPSRSYDEREIPLPPWLSTEPPPSSDRGGAELQGGVLLRPGLGTPTLGATVNPNPFARSRSAPLRLGPVDLWPRLGYDVSYSTGVLTGPGTEDGTWLNVVSPSVTFGLGDHWTVGYTPGISFYTADAYRDTVNHALTLGWQTGWQNWSFQLAHSTSIRNDPLIETAVQTDQTYHVTGLSATLHRGQRGMLVLSVNENLRLTEVFTSSYSWYGQAMYYYPWRPKVNVGVGLGAGYDLLDPGADMFSERLNVNLRGPLTDKLYYELGTGAEVRTFYGAEAPAAWSPLVNATLRYRVFEHTAFSAGFSHEVGTSYYSNQYTENSSVQGGVSQGLGERWSVSASGGYRLTTYHRAVAGGDAVREDGSVFASASVHYRITSRIEGTVYYWFRGNASDRSQFSFDSNQVGLRLNWTL